MKLVILTAIIAAVAASPVVENEKWPWQVDKVYNYDVLAYTWSKFEQSPSNGNAMKAKFTVRVKAPGQLLATMEGLRYAVMSTEMVGNTLPDDLLYDSIGDMVAPFEIFVDGGRVLSLKLPTIAGPIFENIVKGLVSALQVDLSAYGRRAEYPNSYDKESFQGQFLKSEIDITGECDVLYTVSPVSAEWRRELPEFASEEDPIEIVKSKDYGTCAQRVVEAFGVPEGALFNGIAYENDEKQFIKHSSEARFLVGKQGTIYSSQVMSSVSVAPLLFGKQKAEVYSVVKLRLESVEQYDGAEWATPEAVYTVNSLLYTYTEDTFYTKADDQAIANAQKLLQELTPMLQNPSTLPKEDFLSKFNVLTRLLYTMTSEQLDKITASVEVARTAKSVAKSNMWQIYRDAVAQTGTTASFRQVKSWILTKKIEYEEAAQVIASIGGRFFRPSKEDLKELFEFVFTPIVSETIFLNSTALLAATKVFRATKDQTFVTETVIPRFSAELKKAVEQDDSSRIQTYVRVLGQLAHPDVIKVFAPYLEGEVKVSKYIRLQIVTSLKKMSTSKNAYARAVLYSLLKNTAEPYEIRVAAALNIFMTFPPVEMMQVMAHMTNDDPSTQVRAVLANGITFAANLKDPRFSPLAKNAKAVIGLVAKEKYGYRYSTDSIIDLYKEDDDVVTFFRELSFIGSEDNILPVYQRGALRSRTTAATEENSFTYSVSGVQNFLDFIVPKLVAEPEKADADFKFSAKKVAELLNIQREPREKVEYSFFLDNWDQERLYTLDENQIQYYISGLVNRHVDLSDIDVHYTKVLNQRQVWVVFPLVMGMPFVYEYSEPVLVNIEGVVSLERTKEVVAEQELNITYARNLDGQVGFIDTFNDNYARTGVINKAQIFLPTNLKIESSFKNKISITYTFPEQDANVIQYSVWPYSTLQKLDDLNAVLVEPSTKLIERPTKVVTADFKIGYMTGMDYNLQGYSYSNDYKNFGDLFDGDLLKNFFNLVYPRDVALTDFKFKYLASSKNKVLTFTTAYSTLYNQNVEGEMGPASETNDVTPTSENRVSKLTKQVASGIKSANVEVIDIDMNFDGQQKIEYALTAAIADSNIDSKVQAGVSFYGIHQINAVFNWTSAKTIPLNFEEALKSDMKVDYNADVNVGNLFSFQVKGLGKRSEEYTELLKKDPMAKNCLKDISKANFYQKDCYKMIIKAHAPDQFKATVTYKSAGDKAFDQSYYFYQLLKHFYTFEEEENPLVTVPEGTMEFEARAFYYENVVDYLFVTKYGLLILKNVEGMAYYPYAMGSYSPLSAWERTRNWFTGYQNLPYCAVDSSKVWTFSGRSYDYSLSSSWHVVMVDESNGEDKWTDLAILARRPSENQTEVYVSYSSESARYVEVEIKPTGVEVKSNAKKVSEGALTSYWDITEEFPILEYYTLADGVQFFSIQNGAIRIIYDGQRVVIFTDKHRSRTRGICGQSSTQIGDDYKTPFGLVDRAELYGASFALDGEFSDPKTVELKKEAKLSAYQPVTKFTKILKSDAEWTAAMNKSFKGQ